MVNENKEVRFVNIEVANRLVTLRRQHGLSQEDLAEKLGISRQAVSKWERAESSPDTENIVALARLYKISLDALLALDPESARDEAFARQSAIEEIDAINQTFEPHANMAADAQVGSDGAEPDADFYVYSTEQSSSDADELEKAKPADERRAESLDRAPVIKEVKKAKRSNISLKTFPYPVLVTFVFLLTGSLYNIWHPGWMLFLTIPIYYTAIDGNTLNFNKVEFPLIIVPLYLTLGFAFNLWHPGWLIFLTIPIYYWARSSMPHIIINITGILGAALLFILFGFLFGTDRILWLIVVAAALCIGVVFNRKDPEDHR